MLTHNETVESDYEMRKISLEAALRVGCGLSEAGHGSSTDGIIIVKNAELFLKFLKENDDDQKDW